MYLGNIHKLRLLHDGGGSHYFFYYKMSFRDHTYINVLKNIFRPFYVNKRKLRLWMDPCQTDNCQGPPFADNHFKQCNSTVAKIAAVFTMLLY